ncbi:hypothetical protein CF326_g7903 [Tilletia indica]|nr:hypothetical protein CF326_g7903 [Tilletia indica]
MSTAIRMEQWAALAPLTAQERESVSKLATALSEASAASFSQASRVFEEQQGQGQGSRFTTATATGREDTGPTLEGSSMLDQGKPPQALLPDLTTTSSTGPPQPQPASSTTKAEPTPPPPSQTAAITALSDFQRTLDEQVLNEHVLRANVNLAELRAGVRSIETESFETGGGAAV